ncbi:MAG TPA: hypothetical protein VG269_27150 [Tepidisphaeraceae bacterium]|nr:hypothetical protein [Tepidisphaeraceae bacterium]
MIDPIYVLVVNITSYDPLEDQSCILEMNAHTSLTGRSLVNYPRSRVLSDAELESFVAQGLVRLLDPVEPDVLQRIRECAMDSTRIKLDHADILINQGLVD